MTAQVGLMTDEHENIDLAHTTASHCDPQMGHRVEYENVKAEVHLPVSDERQPVKHGASDMTIAAATASDSDKGSSFTPPFSSSSSSSFEKQHSTLQVSSVDRDQDVEGSLSDRAQRRINEARLRYQQANIAFHANSSNLVGARNSSASMDSGLRGSFARKAGPQPLVRFPQHSKNIPYRMDSVGGHYSASFVSQNIPQFATPHGTPITTPISPSQYNASYNNKNATPLSHYDAHHASNPPALDPSSNYNHSHSRQHHNRNNAMRPASGFKRRIQDDWTKWVELGLRISGLPPSTTTRDLYRCFSKEGNIVLIELYENTRSEREGTACVRFRPPPTKPFWNSARFQIAIPNHGNVSVRLNLENRRRTFLHPSPVNPNKKYPESMQMHATSLNFGTMLDQETMLTMCTAQPTSNTKITFRQDMLHREVTIEFPMEIRDARENRRNAVGQQLGKYDRTDCFRFRIPFARLRQIYHVEARKNQMVLLITLETPPSYFKQIDPDHSHDNGRFWKDNDAWYRQTDVVYAPHYLKDKPLTLQKTSPIIDLGRWTTYRFIFDMSKNDPTQWRLMREALHDYNIDIVPMPGFTISSGHRPAVWRFLESKRRTADGFDGLLEESIEELDFEARYQLEVCISQGHLNEYNLDQAFVSRLMNMGTGKARDLLEYVANHGLREFHPMNLFQKQVGDGSLLRSRIPHFCVYIRSATVTPTTVYFQTPVAETSNRVIRQFAEYADRFLRVRFTDEKLEGRIYSTDKNTMNEVFTRVKRVLRNGIKIGNRKYEYLASGNSQFRENGAYFFAPHPALSTERIRDWMGLFSEIETVPMYASRLGQCFSTTRAIRGSNVNLKELADIERNGFNFTDGVGRISPFLARLAADELGILQYSADPPSVFQIRLGGCKGILALSPTSRGRDIHIRRSQYKFAAKHEGLEIIRWSQYACANLNRQLILIMSALGVPDCVFIERLRTQLSKIERAMTDEKTALSILQKDIDQNQMTLCIAGMILDGFQRSNEPFVTSLLQLWRAWSIKYLKEKARITISGGALLFGCVDETATLQGHFDDAPKPPANGSISEKARYVPEVFVQLSKGADDKPEVILGPMLLARNPSLHPGDIRVVVGVDVPELHHLKDVVVLPQTGDRDLAGMCSGGDLDGDDFLVIWDHDLLPSEWNVEPMDYSRPYVPKHGDKIDVDDLTTFFVTYMKNDTLASIAQAHLANADYQEEGVKDEKCLKLASLHSMAVDYIKTGQPAQMTRDLKPPKWPHFMEKLNLPADRVYTSRKILGQLYDQVERVDFVPAYRAPFDDRILNAYRPDADMLDTVSDIKSDYDAHIRRIMAQHEVKTEFEVWSTFVLQHTRTTNAFKFHEVIWELSVALKEQFRKTCYERAGGKDFDTLAPFVAAMYTVTQTEMADAVWECSQFQDAGGRRRPLREMTADTMPLMSFPWLFPDILGKIAKRNVQEVNETNSVSGDAAQILGMTRKGLQAEGGGVIPRRLGRSALAPSPSNAEDDIETAGGVTHRGDMLQLFETSVIDQVSSEAATASPSFSGSSGTSPPSVSLLQ